jgi:hypothetical protein
MPWVGFESTIPASERVKTVHALDRSATLTGVYRIRKLKSCQSPTKGCGWMDGWMDGRTDGRTDGWTDGRTDGRMYFYMYEHFCVQFFSLIISVPEDGDRHNVRNIGFLFRIDAAFAAEDTFHLFVI